MVDSRRWNATAADDGSIVSVARACRKMNTDGWLAFLRMAASSRGRAATAAFPHPPHPTIVLPFPTLETRRSTWTTSAHQYWRVPGLLRRQKAFGEYTVYLLTV